MKTYSMIKQETLTPVVSITNVECKVYEHDAHCIGIDSTEEREAIFNLLNSKQIECDNSIFGFIRLSNSYIAQQDEKGFTVYSKSFSISWNVE